jgi:hypothetical protein
MTIYLANIMIAFETNGEPGTSEDFVAETMRQLVHDEVLLDWGYSVEGDSYTAPRATTEFTEKDFDDDSAFRVSLSTAFNEADEESFPLEELAFLRRMRKAEADAVVAISARGWAKCEDGYWRNPKWPEVRYNRAKYANEDYPEAAK